MNGNVKRIADTVLVLTLLGVAACGEEPPRPPVASSPSASREGSDARAFATHTRPEEVVRTWLEAAKRGDAEAMTALWAEEQRSGLIANPRTFAAQVASGTLHAATWQLGAVAGKGEARAVTAHVLWREHPDGGDNLEFRLVERGDRWWLVGIVHFD